VRERDVSEVLNLIRRLYNVNQEFLENLFDIFFFVDSDAFEPVKVVISNLYSSINLLNVFIFF